MTYIIDTDLHKEFTLGKVSCFSDENSHELPSEIPPANWLNVYFSRNVERISFDLINKSIIRDLLASLKPILTKYILVYILRCMMEGILIMKNEKTKSHYSESESESSDSTNSFDVNSSML